MHEIPNDTGRKTSSVILKRGRTIRKQSEPGRVVVANRHRKLSVDVDNSNRPKETKGVTPVAAVQVGERLLSGTEVEFCPVIVREAVDERPATNPARSERATPLENLTNFSDDYRKLYIPAPPVRSTTENKSNESLLKSIRGIQSSDQNSYGINISNSRFFVPKNYVYSDSPRSMDDLRFEVDPEMGKLLHESMEKNKSRVGLNFNGSLPDLVDEAKNSEKNVSALSRSLHSLPVERSENMEKFDDLAHKRQRMLVAKENSRASRAFMNSLLDRESDVLNVDELSRKKLNAETSPKKEESGDRGGTLVVAKPIIVGDPSRENDFVIGTTLRNPNPSLIIEPTMYVPRESSLDSEGLVLSDASPIDSVFDYSDSKAFGQPKRFIRRAADRPNSASVDEMGRVSRDGGRCNSYPAASSVEKSKDLPTIASIRMRKKISTVSEQNKFDESATSKDSKIKRGEISEVSNSDEGNMKRMKFTEKPVKLSTKTDSLNAPPKTSRVIAIARTYSLKEKFEPIVEDVELRSGRFRFSTGNTIARKSANQCQKKEKKNIVCCPNPNLRFQAKTRGESL